MTTAMMSIERANRVIVWGSVLSLALAVPAMVFSLRASRAPDATDLTAVFVAAALILAYLILVAGIIVVGVHTHTNLALRRADAALDTPRNRWHYQGGIAFCLCGLSFILLPVL